MDVIANLAYAFLNLEIGSDQLFEPMEGILGNKTVGPASRSGYLTFLRIIICENEDANIRMNGLDFLGEPKAALSR